MEWLRTNGVCFRVVGMVKRALIECTEKGAFPKQWEDCALLSEAKQIYSKICAHCADTSSAAPLRQPSLHRSAAPGLAVNLGYFSPACSAGGLGLRRDAFAESRSSPWISAAGSRCNQGNCVRAGAVLGAALCELRWTPHCNKSNLTAGTGWNATTTPDPLPPIRVEPCIRGHYITQLFPFGSSDTPELGEVDCQEAGSFPPPFFLPPLPVSRSLPCWLSPLLSLQFILVIATGQCERIAKVRALIQRGKKQLFFL